MGEFCFYNIFRPLLMDGFEFFIIMQDTRSLLTGGFEKLLRIFDLNRPEAPPIEIEHSPGSVRTVAYLHSDQTILSSCSDSGGVRYVITQLFHSYC